MKHTPSPQQQALFDWVKSGSGSAVVNAVAGSGKTTTLIAAIEHMTGDVALVAYNKAIALEFERKLGEADLQAKAGTAHSFGFQAWRGANNGTRLTVDDREKYRQITESLAVPQLFWSFVKKLVSIAKQAGLGFLHDETDNDNWQALIDHYGLDYELADEANKGNGELAELVRQGVEWAKLALARGIELARSIIDFDDMIYMPLLCGCNFFQYDWVLVDEAQDTNASRRELYKRLVRPGTGRAIYVGDPGQAIYGFTGADSDALELCKAQHDAVELSLSVTYRCPKSVAALAQSIVPCIEAASWNAEGTVQSLSMADFEDSWLGKDKASCQLLKSDAVLCRNTKPLVELAFALIRRGVGCHVEGREIGTGLTKLAGRWKVKDLNTLRERLATYLEREEKKLLDKGREAQAEALRDKVETLGVIMDAQAPSSSVVDLVAHITGMFSDTPDGKPSLSLTLSTVHKAKGREWKRVFLYREDLIPSRYAVRSWQKQQEKNLLYVAWTRTLDMLVRVRG